MGPTDYGKQQELLLHAKMTMSAIRGGIDNKKFKEDKQLMTACYNIMVDMYLEIIDLKKQLDERRKD